MSGQEAPTGILKYLGNQPNLWLLSHTLSTHLSTHVCMHTHTQSWPSPRHSPNPRSSHGPYTLRKTSPQPCSTRGKGSHPPPAPVRPPAPHLPVATRWRQHQASRRPSDWPRPKEGVPPRPSSPDLRLHRLGHICGTWGPIW